MLKITTVNTIPMDAAPYKLKTARHGDTYKWPAFTLPELEKYNFTGAIVEIKFKSSSGAIVQTLKSPTQILLNLPYGFSVPDGITKMPPGEYTFTVHITFADGRAYTFITGSHLVI